MRRQRPKLTYRNPKQSAAAIAVFLFAALAGILFIRLSDAATYVLSAEAESGAVSGTAGKLSGGDATGASASGAVRFGTGASPGGSCASTTNTAKPPAGGYFQLRPPGSYASLPNDAAAAAQVRCSKWEPRPDNHTANHTVPTGTLPKIGYDAMENYAALFGRVTGNFTGTTDEIIQWAAIKWGLSDEMIRGEAVAESYWYQNRKTSSGQPYQNYGYGDYGNCPATTRYPATGPASYGLMQIKWCQHNFNGQGGYGTWPWSEDSTAYNLDYFGAIIRGCYEGWDYVGPAGGGDLWGCVGRWYSGDWHDQGAEEYITRVKQRIDEKTWLSW
jgi:hypothetical protein